MERRRYDIRDILNTTPVKEIMSQPVTTINKDKHFSEVENIFVNQHIRHLPVVNDSGTLVGLMTKRDLYKTLSPRRALSGEMDASLDNIVESEGVYYSRRLLDKFILEKIMKIEVCTLLPEDSVGQAIRIMFQNKFGSVVIVDKDRKVQGMITRFDILRLASQFVDAPDA